MRYPSEVEKSRLAALAGEIQAGTGAVVSLSWSPTNDQPGAAVQFTEEATQQQRDAIGLVVQNWDWSEAADLAARKAAARQAAKEAFGSTDNPTRVAARNADRALFRSLIQTRNTVNLLIDAVNALPDRAGLPAIPRLTNRTFAQAMAGAAALIDAETGPAAD